MSDPPDSALSSIFFSQGTPKAQVFLLCSRQAQSLAVICKPRPRAMYFRASPCLCAALIVASVSQTAKQWLIGARQSDLRQREHTQSYSSRSNSSTITGPHMSYVIQAAMHDWAGAAEGMVWHSDSLGVTLLLQAVGKVGGRWSRKSSWKERLPWREYWHVIDTKLAKAVRKVGTGKFWLCKNCRVRIRKMCTIFMYLQW